MGGRRKKGWRKQEQGQAHHGPSRGTEQGPKEPRSTRSKPHSSINGAPFLAAATAIPADTGGKQPSHQKCKWIHTCWAGCRAWKSQWTEQDLDLRTSVRKCILKAKSSQSGEQTPKKDSNQPNRHISDLGCGLGECEQ